MKGSHYIGWIWDWLGDGSMSENYELIPVVQPVVPVDAIDYPFRLQGWNSGNVNLVMGALDIQLPLPPSRHVRIWMDLEYARSATAGGDLDELLIVSPTVTTAIVRYNLANFIGGGVVLPLVRGVLRVLIGAALIEFRGIPPIVSTLNDPLLFRASSAAAAGTVVVQGFFVDAPDTAPMMQTYLR